MDPLDVELDAGDAAFPNPLFLDEIQPFVVDAAGLEVCWRKPGAAAQVVVTGQTGLGENSVYGAAAATAVRCERVVDHRLRAVSTARHRRQRLLRRSFANDWLRGGHGDCVCR